MENSLDNFRHDTESNNAQINYQKTVSESSYVWPLSSLDFIRYQGRDTQWESVLRKVKYITRQWQAML